MSTFPFSLGLLTTFLMLASCTNNGADQNTQNSDNQTDIPLNRFEEEIKTFEVEDSQKGIKTGGILFTGSSSIRMWNSLKDDMEGLPVLNRGFGGSTLPEVAYYAKRIILPYKPAIIVLYCGENDLNDGESPEAVLHNFKGLVARLRAWLPRTDLFYISMKPSIARWPLWDKFQTGNELIEAYIDTHKHLHYLDSGAKMLNAGGTIDSSIFIQDGLHMNELGYARWTEMVRPVLTAAYSK